MADIVEFRRREPKPASSPVRTLPMELHYEGRRLLSVGFPEGETEDISVIVGLLLSAVASAVERGVGGEDTTLLVAVLTERGHITTKDWFDDRPSPQQQAWLGRQLREVVRLVSAANDGASE